MGLQPKEWIKNQKEKLGAAVRGVAGNFQNQKKIGQGEHKVHELMEKAGGQASGFCLYTSEAVIQTGKRLAVYAEAFFGKKWRRLSGGFKKAGVHAKEGLLVFWGRFSKPFVSMAYAPRLIAEGYREGKAKGAAAAAFRGLCNNKGFFRTIFNYGAPVLGAVVLCNVVVSASNVTYAVEVKQDGQLVGYIADESVLTSAQDMLRQRIIRTDGTEATFELDPELSVVAVNEDLLSNANEMTDSLIRMSNEDISEAQGLYIDGEFYGAVTDTALIEDILNTTLDSYRTGAEGETVSFVQDIELREGLYLTESLVSSEEMETLLNSTQEAERTYTIVEGDSPTLIADKNGVPYSEFKKLNPGIEETCLIGQEAIISTEKPFLSVKVVREETYTESIPYETEKTEDNSQYEGYTKTVQAGQEGVEQITASVEYVDGYETTRTVVSTEVIQEPVTEKIVEGTKQKETASYARGQVLAASSGSGSYGGSFLWPVAGNGYISCGYSSGHRAIDIACSYGTPIVASASGKVIVAGWYYTYGKAVVIDHGNGVQTLYGHNSTLNVSVGDYVSQGQVIAGAGSTGYSTGNHCHFEVHVNGGRYNPLNYLY